ncbi:MAG: protein kinase, partial [Acidimicrobiales bacterium]|nr:protein kinase [Acidimicrobiales bacterium]
MGEVWTGWDRRLQREVAVKLLLPQLSEEPAFRQRFETEARAAAALDHPNIVQVFDIDQDDGTLFIVMERLPGPSLDRRLAEGPLTEEEVRRVAADLLAGLAAAH